MPDQSPPTAATVTKALLAIVTHAAADRLQQGLLAEGLRVTRINTAGGFLRRGNVTFLIGVASEDVGRAIAAVRAHAGKSGGWIMVSNLANFTRV